jgi:hypothetical protein
MVTMRKLLVLAVLVLAFVAVPIAAAGSSVLTGYGASSQPVVEVKGATESSKPSSSGPSTLPFTGTDLGVFVVAGVLLVGVGFGLRRLGRNKA